VEVANSYQTYDDPERSYPLPPALVSERGLLTFQIIWSYLRGEAAQKQRHHSPRPPPQWYSTPHMKVIQYLRFKF